jgi:hypothetical protein
MTSFVHGVVEGSRSGENRECQNSEKLSNVGGEDGPAQSYP